MSPRAAGWCAIVGAAVLAVAGGYLLATPPWSIPGALVLVAATILLSVGTVWVHRRSWSEPWPPDVTPSLQKQLRRLRVLQIGNSVVFVLMIAVAVYAIVDADWWKLLWAALLLLLRMSNFTTNRSVIRRLRELEAVKPPSTG
jgi:hypothetical protein